MPPRQRYWYEAVFDYIFAWQQQLPPARCSYTFESFRIPVDENVNLAADLYRPTIKPLATILVRTPYGINLPESLHFARMYATRGYQVLTNSCRGTFASDGNLEAGRYESADGQAVIAWMRQQPWYNGSFAAVGGSFLGYTQWALLDNPPKDMITAVINSGPHDFGWLVWSHGALKQDILPWADLTSRMRRGDGFISIMLFVMSMVKNLRSIYDATPLLEAIEKHLAERMPNWLRQGLTTPDQKDDLWKPVQHYDALRKVEIPILLTTGWDDPLLREVIEQYEALSARSCPVRLDIGPWTHLGAQRQYKDYLAWFNAHFADDKTSTTIKSGVRVHINGIQEWRDLPKWPPPSSHVDLFLQPGKKLSRDTPEDSSSQPSTFKFDPAQPTPAIAFPAPFDTVSGRTAGDHPLASRSDVVTYVTEPLDQDVEVCGRPAVELYHSSDHPHVDLLVLLSELHKNEKSYTISETYQRLDNEPQQSPRRLELSDCGHVFKKGNRIRLLIAGGSHPRYIRNLGSGESAATGTRLQVAWHTVQHNGSAMSKLTLPVTSGW